MEVVEVSPPYDVSDMTSLMATRVICDTMAHLVKFRASCPEPRNASYIHEEANMTVDEPVAIVGFGF
jgi:agmatinase